jgi:phage shock protein C
MSLSEELNRLDELHRRGALGDDEFSRAKSRLLQGRLPADGCASGCSAVSAVNALRRSRGDRWFTGVCGGLARATGVESWIWRLSFTAFSLCGGVGLLLYLLLWIFVPREPA